MQCLISRLCFTTKLAKVRPSSTLRKKLELPASSLSLTLFTLQLNSILSCRRRVVTQARFYLKASRGRFRGSYNLKASFARPLPVWQFMSQSQSLHIVRGVNATNRNLLRKDFIASVAESLKLLASLSLLATPASFAQPRCSIRFRCRNGSRCVVINFDSELIA